MWRICWGVAVRRLRSRTMKSARIAGFQAAFLGFAELGEGGGLGVGVDGFGEGEALLGVEGLGAGLVLAGDGGVEAAEGGDGLDGVVGAEGQGDVVVEHGAPGVGVFGCGQGRGGRRPRPCR